MATAIKGILAGRSWDVDSLDGTGSGDTHKGVSQVTRVYLIERESVSWTASDEKSYEELFASSGLSLPKIGDAHGNGDSSLRVSKISYSEGSSEDKYFLKATVTYSRTGEEQTEQGQGAVDCACEAWGWHGGSVQRDLMDHDANGNATPIVNSAGDPFDSVPQVDFSSPTFTKVFKVKSRISGAQGYANKVNAASLTIGGIAGAAYTLRCTAVNEERIFNDPLGYKYRYTVSLQYLSNVANIGNPAQSEEIGWDVAVADTGLRAKEYPGGGGQEILMHCQDVDENGNKTPVSSPVPLNGDGHRSPDGSVVFLRFHTYPTTTFPTVFYTEP